MLARFPYMGRRAFLILTLGFGSGIFVFYKQNTLIKYCIKYVLMII